jgi:hypothetical protein
MTEESAESEETESEESEETTSEQEDLAEDVINALDATHQGGKPVYSETVVIGNIRRGLKKTVEGTLLIGQWLTIARGKGGVCYPLTTQAWDAWLKRNVSLTKSEASKYMAIWANPVFQSVSDLKQFDKLPGSYTVLYALASAAKDNQQGTALLQQLLDAGELRNVNTEAAAEIVHKLKPKPAQVTGRPSAKVLQAKLSETEEDLFTVKGELDQAKAELADTQRQLDHVREDSGDEDDSRLGEILANMNVPQIADALITAIGPDACVTLSKELGTRSGTVKGTEKAA